MFILFKLGDSFIHNTRRSSSLAEAKDYFFGTYGHMKNKADTYFVLDVANLQTHQYKYEEPVVSGSWVQVS